MAKPFPLHKRILHGKVKGSRNRFCPNNKMYDLWVKLFDPNIASGKPSHQYVSNMLWRSTEWPIYNSMNFTKSL